MSRVMGIEMAPERKSAFYLLKCEHKFAKIRMKYFLMRIKTMSMKTADIHIRINPGLKAQAEDYFEKNGVTMSQALEQFLAWTVKHQKTPMRLKRRANIPDENLMTREEIQAMLDETMKEVEEGKYVTLEQFKKDVEKKHGIRLEI